MQLFSLTTQMKQYNQLKVVLKEQYAKQIKYIVKWNFAQLLKSNVIIGKTIYAGMKYTHTS